VAYRAGYVLVTVALAFAVNKTTKVRIFDRLVFGWIFFTVIFVGLFNFTRPANYLATPFDIIIPFAIYTLSPLPMKQSLALAVGFSIGTLYVDHFHKFGVDPIALNAIVYALVIMHVLGISAALQLQSYRRRSFKAYLDEKDAKEMVAFLSNIDMLTKSLTRRQFLNIAESEFRRFLRYRRPFSILIIDADRFKSINDTYGHHAGDIALRSLSLVAMEQKRAQDTFGRLGGEEFGLLMPETNLAQGIVVAERIRQTWEETPVNLDGELIHSTISIGAAEAISGDESIEDLLRRTDRMLYKAKEAGRNRVMFE
jgi:diguanylate cyclase (GGDEF)-like protein